MLIAGFSAVADCANLALSRLVTGSEVVVRSPDHPPGPLPTWDEGEFDANMLASKAVWLKIGWIIGVGIVEAGTRVRTYKRGQA